MPDVCRFQFDKAVDKEFIEDHIALAILMAECTFGQARVRLNAGYFVSGNKAIIDVSSDVGEYIAQIFTGLMIRKLGENKFTIQKIRNKE